MGFLVGERKKDPWSVVMAAFLQVRAQRGLTRDTLLHDRRIVGRFQAFLRRQGVKEPASLASAHLEAWQALLQKKRWRKAGSRGHGPVLAPSTRFRDTSTVLAFVRFLFQMDHVLLDPRQGFRRSRFTRVPHRFIPTIDEVRRLLDSIETREPQDIQDRAVLELLYSSGLRAAEARQLDLYDLDLKAGHLRVRGGKGGRDRLVPVGSRAVAALEAYIVQVRAVWWRPESGEALFLSSSGNRFHSEGIRHVCRRRRASAGLPFLTPHRLRHACATHLLLGGADIRHVQEILGHRLLQTTEHYTHLAPIDLVGIHQACHPRGER